MSYHPDKVTAHYWEKYMGEGTYSPENDYIFYTSNWVEHFNQNVDTAIKQAAKSYGLDPDRFSSDRTVVSPKYDYVRGAWAPKDPRKASKLGK